MAYSRILLKLSGEQLSGQYDSGIDIEFCRWLAGQIRPVVASGTQVVIMVGGGNYVRGAQLAGESIHRVTADNIGMLATMMNATALSDIWNAEGVESRALSSIVAEQIVDPFTHRRAVSHLHKNRVVIVGGGIGRPYLTTDTAAVSLALELSCKAVLKATKVDGIYDKDPAKYPDAIRYESLDFQTAVADDHVKVMDKAALGLAMEHELPLVVFDATDDGAIARVVAGEAVGTKIS